MVVIIALTGGSTGRADTGDGVVGIHIAAIAGEPDKRDPQKTIRNTSRSEVLENSSTRSSNPTTP